MLDGQVNNVTCNRSCDQLPGVWPSCINPSVPDGPGSRASLLEHHHLVFLRRGWPPSSDSNAYYFWGKINSVLRCYQKLSHALNSAMFIEPVKTASSSYGRKGRELGKRGSLRASVRTDLGMWPARGWGHRMLRVDPPHLFTFPQHPSHWNLNKWKWQVRYTNTKRSCPHGQHGSIHTNKNTQKNHTKKGLNDLDNHDGVLTHVQPDILECEVKWALGSIATNKAGGGDRIPAELFQILK